MRIKFTKEVFVELNDIPKSAWGRIQKRPVAVTPTINPETNQFEIPSGSEMRHAFPANAVVELPEELAEYYINSGNAIEYEGPTGSRVKVDRGVSRDNLAYMETIS